MRYDNFKNAIPNQQLLFLGVQAIKDALKVSDNEIEVLSWDKVNVSKHKPLSHSPMNIDFIATLDVHLHYERSERSGEASPESERWRCTARAGTSFDSKTALTPEDAIDTNRVVSGWMAV